MASTDRSNRELMMKSKKAAQTAQTPIDKLRHACLARGANGIQGLARFVPKLLTRRNKFLKLAKCFHLL